MGVFCMAPGCSNEGYNKKDVSYHGLPLQQKQKLALWLNQMKLKNPPVNKFSKVCSDHFEKDCFERDLRAELMGTKIKHLLKDSAVPTLFNFNKCINSKRATVNAKPGRPGGNPFLKSTPIIRGDRVRAREQRKSVLKIHKSPEQDIHVSCESVESPPNIEPLMVSVGVQTDAPPPTKCTAPCCNGDPPKCQAPCCTEGPINCKAARYTNTCRIIPPSSMSTPKKAPQQDVPPLQIESDLSLFSDISCVDSDSSYEAMDSEDFEDDDEDHHIEDSGEYDDEMIPIQDEKYIVFNNSLKQLFTKCHGDSFCAAPVVELHQKHRGTMVIVEGTCLNNHDFTWRSQPVIRRVAVGNLLLASAVLYTGNTYTTLSEICETFKLQIFSESQFYVLQKEYMLPTVNKIWKSHQEQLLSGYVGKTDLVLAGDGRCDSPGHCATFGTYSLMDVTTNLILASNVVKVTEVKNSYNMENEGLLRCISELQKANVSISTLATDRHPQISKTMRDKYPDISHQYDVWHLGKSLGKKLNAAAKRKTCEDLQPWVKSIKHHLWWCADTCNGDVTQLKERWLSILRHIVNKHEWIVASVYTKCSHEELTEDEERSKEWLKPGSPAHKALQNIVGDKRFLKDIELITEFCHTGDLEVFHNVLLKYTPKRLSFSYEGTVVRTMLAVLDNNMNVGRKQAETQEGEMRFKLQWSKGSQNFVVRKVTSAKDFVFREDLMKGTLDRLINGTDSQDGALSVPELARNTIGKGDKPTKSDAVQNHVTRFRTNMTNED